MYNAKEPGEVLSVIRTLRILEALAEKDKASLSEIASAVGGTKSTVYRFLATLIDQGYARQDEDDSYRPTLKLFQIGMRTFSKIDLVDKAMPSLKSLSATTKETIHLATRENGSLVYLTKIESSYSLRVSMQSQVGSEAPQYCTGVGKALLAWLPEEEIREYADNCDFKRYTLNTICDKEAFVEELAEIRLHGYSFDNEEHEEGVRCIAAPIRDLSGKVCASVSISGPSVRLTDARLEEFLPVILSCARKISSEMGYIG